MSEQAEYPLISVIIPSFNQGQFIEETLLSVLGQNYPKLELIVIDGGSTDKTVEILENYSNRISYWHSQKDDGQGDAINKGINMSHGDVICWLNSDDMFLPGILFDVAHRFKDKLNENYLIYGASISLYQSGEELNAIANPSSPFDAFTLTYKDFIVQPSTFWTRKLWQTAGELNLTYNYVLDWDWFIRASKIAKVEYISKFYSIYRYHPNHKTSRGGAARRKEVLTIVKTYSSEYWAALFTEVDQHYERVIKAIKLLGRIKLPKRHLLLPFLFPRFAIKLKSVWDVFEVVGMYE